jgi:hypothetical protein
MIINIFLLLLGIMLIIISVISKSDAEKCTNKLKRNNLYILITGIASCVISITHFILNSHGWLKVPSKFSF